MRKSGHNAVRDLGTERCSFSDDLKERVWVSKTGLSWPDIYAGAKLFSALYANTHAQPYCTLSVNVRKAIQVYKSSHEIGP